MDATTEKLTQILQRRIMVLDGAMGTMLQEADPSLDDFEGHEGCNEILNVTRPDVVRGIHDAPEHEDGVEVGAKYDFPLRHRKLDGRMPLDRPGVVHQDVDVTDGLCNLVNEALGPFG